jgi:hypothetical protein
MTEKPSARDFNLFGELVWRWVTAKGGDIFCHEDSEELMQFAAKAGLVKRVVYDPALHGEIEATPGDEIWYWGETAETKVRAQL